MDEDLTAAYTLTLESYPLGSIWRVNNEVRHIRAIVDDDYFVWRVWSKHKQRWYYSTEYWYRLYLDLQAR